MTSALVNDACLQTIPRTVNTGLGAMFILAALVLLGGDTLTDFALALLVGILVGTYSSVFVASPLVVAFERGNHGAVQGPAAPARRPSVPSRAAGASARQQPAAQAAGPAAEAETNAPPRRRPAQPGSRKPRGRSGSRNRRR